MTTALTETTNTAAETIEIVELDESDVAALWSRYDSQLEPQDCYVQLDCESGVLKADWNGEIGNGVPVRVWSGEVIRWSIPCLRAAAANELLREIQPLAARVVAGFESIWDGSNYVGHLDEDATAAKAAIGELCQGASDNDCVVVWEAAEWCASVGDDLEQAAEFGITATTTDADLSAIGDKISSEADEADVLCGLGDHLASLRDAVRDAADEE